MTDKFEFDDAYQELLDMVKEIESDNVSLKDLAQKIAEAKTLVTQCEKQLRVVDDEVSEATGADE